MWFDDLISYIRSFFRKKPEYTIVEEYETMHFFDFEDKEL